MIDFRYHIVSLISVFLALAVGIILGAGPLKGPIGDQLTGQVDQLREERNQLRDELTDTSAQLDDGRAYIEAAGPQLVAGSLEGKDVAVVGLGALDDDRFAPILDQLQAAGATVSGRIDITESWTSKDDEDFRKVVSDGMAVSLPPAAEETPSTRLSDALVVALTGADESDASARSGQAVSLQEVLVRSDLVTVVDEPTAPADMILFVAPPAEEASSSAPSDAASDAPAESDSYAVDIELELPRAASAEAESTVVAGPSATDGDLVSRVREDDDTAKTVSTVSGVGAVTGQINVPLALAAGAAGEVGHFGFEDSATAIIPPVPGSGSDGATPSGTPTDGEG